MQISKQVKTTLKQVLRHFGNYGTPTDPPTNRRKGGDTLPIMMIIMVFINISFFSSILYKQNVLENLTIFAAILAPIYLSMPFVNLSIYLYMNNNYSKMSKNDLLFRQ